MKPFITTIMTRLVIPPHVLRVALLNELWRGLAEVEVVAVFCLVAELRAGAVAAGEVAVGLVVDGLVAGTVAFDEPPKVSVY